VSAVEFWGIAVIKGMKGFPHLFWCVLFCVFKKESI